MPWGGETLEAIRDRLPAGGGLTDTQLRAAAVPVSGPLTDTQLRASVLPMIQGAPAAADILCGFQSFTATTGATTLITVPAGRTWIGEIGASVDCAIAAASATAGQALAVFTTAGAGVTPAAGTYLAVEARAGANAATGAVGSSATNFACAAFVVVAPGGNSVTVQVASTNAGTSSRVDAFATGRLV